MTLRYSNLKLPVFLYLSLPIFLFLAFFLRLTAAVPCIAAYAAVLCFALRKDPQAAGAEKQITVPARTLTVLFLLVLLWTFLGGLNGHWFQTSDWDCRNAIFRDLITHDWPVRYQNGSALVYYIGHWLPAAGLAKLLLPLGGLDLAWAVGQNLLWLWTAVGVYFVLLLLLTYHGVEGEKQLWLVVLLFVFFSGMDLIGVFVTNHVSYIFSPEVLHLEWWFSRYQFSSITTCIYWVFNQSVIPWLTVACFLQERTPRNYIFLCIACLSCGPFPLLGLAILMLVRGIRYLAQGIRAHAAGQSIRELLLPGNLLGAVTVVPVYLIYYLCNNATSGTAAEEGGLLSATLQWFSEGAVSSLLYFLVFFALEAGAYLVLVYRDQKRNPLYYTVFASLLLIPHFRVGRSNDFCMRVSIPGVFLLMVFCGEALLKHWDELKMPKFSQKAQTLLLVVCLLIGAATPCVEIGRGFYHVLTEHTTELACDPIYSFENESVTYNFSTEFPNETIFFRHLARQ